MTRKEMINKMINIYGENHEITQQYIEMCNNLDGSPYNDQVLMLILDCHEKFPCE